MPELLPLSKLSSQSFLQMEERHFSLSLHHSSRTTKMTMQMTTPVFHTCDIPATYEILNTLLPEVLNTKCFNENKYSFTQEVKNTEIGHLFEHILLEYLCQEKLKDGFNSVSFRGVTDWNWVEDPRGTFHISINVRSQDLEYFTAALQKSIQLLNLILDTQQIDPSIYN